jgi:acyl carrier protein
MDQDDLERRVMAFLSKQLGVRPAKLRADARLMQDLGVDGDDGWELLNSFSREFDVDVSELQPTLHFGPEAPFNPFLFLQWWLEPGTRPRFVPITVADLVTAAHSRRWSTPDALNDQGHR